MSHDRGCPCGRESDEYDTCPKDDCYKRTRTMTMKTEKKYLWVKEDRAPMFVTDLIALYKDRDYDPNTDKIYEIGPEVKIELSVKVIPAHPVHRDRSYQEGTR
jgi:hypothetical protein